MITEWSDEQVALAQAEQERDALHARIAELTARAEFAERERDENLLKSGDITCMETDRPGCGLCTLCLGAERDLALARAATAEREREELGERLAAAEGVALAAVTSKVVYVGYARAYYAEDIDRAMDRFAKYVPVAIDAARRATTTAPAPKVPT